MAFTIDGIVSGFETSSIIESLLGFQQTQIDTFDLRKSEIATQQSAFKGIEAQLLSFRGTLGQLNRTHNSVFDVQTATSSNEDLITTAASSGAANGTYSLTVNSLATAHQAGSQGFASSTSTIATGDMTFQVGDHSAKTITIGQDNNTLTGLINTINEELDDVTASIVHDQGSSSYRVLLTSKYTGADNQIVVTNNLNGGTGTEPDFSGPAIQEAANALITLGSGPGAITAQYATNQVDDLIENVTLNLESADPTRNVTISVSQDIDSAQDSIESFVDEFNSIMEFIDSTTQYNPETDQASPLIGNRSVSKIQNSLREFVIDSVPGLESNMNRLASIGVDIDSRGRLTVDSVKLNKALSGDLEGVDPKEIRNLFGLNGNSSNAGIEFITGGPRTVDSTTPYEVDITQAAEQASVTGSNPLAASTVIGSGNKEFQITLNGVVSEMLTLQEGTYTQEELAAHVENVINGSSVLGIHNVDVTLDSNQSMVITSEVYGSNSKISSVSGAASGDLGFLGTETDTGQDVAGSFIVNGVTEIATGSGLVLIGDSDNEHTADLQLRVTLTSAQVVAGNEAEVLVTRGVSGRVDKYISDLLDEETGAVKSINEAFELRIDSLDESIQRVKDLTESKREYLIKEFTALETIINKLQTTGDFLTAQLSTLNNNNN